jgi:hypothetical protein
MPQKAKCASNAGGFVSVSLTEFYPAMTVLQYGTALAAVILLLEVLYFHRSVNNSLHLGLSQYINLLIICLITRVYKHSLYFIK